MAVSVSMRPPFLCLSFLALATGLIPSRAELVSRDLGQGLGYFRAHALPDELPPASVKPGPMVLDLRFTSAEGSANTALDAWLKFRATPETPVFLLINSDTAPILRRLLAAGPARPGVVTLGGSAEDFTPDIVIGDSADEERRAYDALEHGASVLSLTTENAGKPRVDEASIMHDRANPPAEIAESDPLDLQDKHPAEPTSPPPPSAGLVAIDHSLQRAVQLHRSLLALKRL
jgi:hypothetical protein